MFDNPIVKRLLKRWAVKLKIVGKYLKKFYKELLHILIHLSGNMAFRITAVIISMVLLLFICILFQVGNRFDPALYVINIPKGYSAGQVAGLLQQRGIIDGRYGFNLLINIFGLQNKLQAGTYEFTPRMSLIRIVWKLKKGDIIPPMLCRIVFPEGASIYRMGDIMEKEGVGDGIAFQGLTGTYLVETFRKKYPFLLEVPGNSLEGYLFPDTYMVPSNISAERLADLMLARFNKVIMPYWNKNYRKMRSKFGLHEILTLASIIEKEAVLDSERSMISSVYHNRLRIRMHLGADPTIKYVLESPGKIVSYDDLNVDSPYNTYKRYGLPPGPICSPGLKSIKAAMFPAETDYFYFVARADGSHIFSKTWQEHEDAKAATKTERIRKIFRRK